MRLARPVLTAAAVASAALLAGCSGSPDAVPVAQEDPRAPAWLPSGEPDAGTVPTSPLALPPAPTASASAAPSASASSSVRSTTSTAPTPAAPELPCDGTADAPLTGDLDGDGAPETAVPVRCPQSDAVLVFAGSEELGNALPAEEQAELHAVEVRDGYLVVVALAEHGEGAEDDVAVTTRWQVRSGALVRTDRWLDPAYVLEVDAGD